MSNCKRCLLREMNDSTLYERIRRTIESIPESQKCSSKEYEKRLQMCRQCDRLLGGICRVCGCFVEVRAVREKEHCPFAGEKLW